ncbi:MAG: DUF4388 domain-containing protein [Polyangiaceae bacterium]|nr:DUF4388 domain-containing protein [Polyangiaceae bacterium]
MSDERQDLVRIDATGTAHPVGKAASRGLRARQGAFRLMPSPGHIVIMRCVGEDGQRDDEDGPVFRLAGEITTPGALCDIVSLIGHAGWNGELVVLDGATSRSLFFEHGAVIGARSSLESDRIGEVLYRYGAITREQIAATLEAAAPDERFGQAAVRLGFTSRGRLYQLLASQAEEIAYGVLLVGDGMFFFLDRFDEEQIASRQNLSVSALLMDVVRRMDETRYFRERIPSEQHVPVRVPDRSPPSEKALRDAWDAIDGQRPVAEIARITGLGEFAITQALFQLAQAGKVVVHAPRPTGPRAMTALFNDAIAMIFAEVDLAGRGEEVRAQLASFATGAGIYDALFRGAGPAASGTLDVAKVIENAEMLAGPGQADAMLSQWLYEYVSFAMFVAEPYLRAGSDVSAGSASGAPGHLPSGAGPASRRGEALPLSRRIAELVGPLAPK